jgi:hypothetical protein
MRVAHDFIIHFVTELVFRDQRHQFRLCDEPTKQSATRVITPSLVTPSLIYVQRTHALFIADAPQRFGEQSGD